MQRRSVIFAIGLVVLAGALARAALTRDGVGLLEYVVAAVIVAVLLLLALRVSRRATRRAFTTK
jgi:Tfp pilus assembly protein FimT